MWDERKDGSYLYAYTGVQRRRKTDRDGHMTQSY